MFAKVNKGILTRFMTYSARNFSGSAVRCNLIKNLYLKELKNVKVTSMDAQDVQGSVKTWSEPPKPKVPHFGVDASAAGLKAYEEQEVETAAENVTEASAGAEEGDWLVLEEVQEPSHNGGH